MTLVEMTIMTKSLYLFIFLVLLLHSCYSYLERIVRKFVKHEFFPGKIVVNILCGSLRLTVDRCRQNKAIQRCVLFSIILRN